MSNPISQADALQKDVLDPAQAQGQSKEPLPSVASLPSSDVCEVNSEEVTPPPPVPSEPSGSASEGDEGVEDEKDMRTITDHLPRPLPDYMTVLLAKFSSPVTQDALLLAILTMLSSCMPNVYGLYDYKIVYTHLYLLVTSMAGCGKGILSFARDLISPIDVLFARIFEEQMKQYEVKLAEYNRDRNSIGEKAAKPTPPIRRMLFIPANSSEAALNSALESNNGVGAIYETEADTMTAALRSSNGPCSAVFRQAFHHEPIMFYRKTMGHPVVIDCPKISILLAGTPAQVGHLIPTTENGLFSRFMFYKMNNTLSWHNVFKFDSSIQETFKTKAEEFVTLYNALTECPGYRILLTEKQAEKFNRFFSQAQLDYQSRYGIGMVASVRRMGLSAFRICMIFSILRNEQEILNSCPNTIQDMICHDDDFENALYIAEVILEHIAAIYMTISQIDNDIDPVENPNGLYDKLYNALPQYFRAQTALEIAAQFQISSASCERNLKSWVAKGALIRVRRGEYKKVEKS